MASIELSTPQDVGYERDKKKKKLKPMKSIRRLFTFRRKAHTVEEPSKEAPEAPLRKLRSSSTSDDTKLNSDRRSRSLAISRFSISADDISSTKVKLTTTPEIETASSLEVISSHPIAIPTKVPDGGLRKAQRHQHRSDDGLPDSPVHSDSNDKPRYTRKSLSRESGMDSFNSCSSLDSDSDLDSILATEALDVSAAKHKIAIRPKARRKTTSYQKKASARSTPNLSTLDEETSSPRLLRTSRTLDDDVGPPNTSHLKPKVATVKKSNSLSFGDTKALPPAELSLYEKPEKETKVPSVLKKKVSTPVSPEAEKLNESINSTKTESVLRKKSAEKSPSSPPSGAENDNEFSKVFGKFKNRQSSVFDEKTGEYSEVKGPVDSDKKVSKAKGPVDNASDKKVSKVEKVESNAINSKKESDVQDIKKSLAEFRFSATENKSDVKQITPPGSAAQKTDSAKSVEEKKRSVKTPASPPSTNGTPDWIALAKKKQPGPSVKETTCDNDKKSTEGPKTKDLVSMFGGTKGSTQSSGPKTVGKDSKNKPVSAVKSDKKIEDAPVKKVDDASGKKVDDTRRKSGQFNFSKMSSKEELDASQGEEVTSGPKVSDLMRNFQKVK